MLDNLQESGAVFLVVLKSTLVVLAVLALIYLALRFSRRQTSIRLKYRWTMTEKLIYLGFVVTVAILGTTAFVSILVNHAMHGWWLLVHLGGAGGFVALLTIMSWTLSFRFMVTGAQVNDPSHGGRPFPLPVKILYWISMILCIPVVGSILLSMFPVYGTEDMVKLIALHRYAGLALFSAVTLHCLLIFIPKG